MIIMEKENTENNAKLKVHENKTETKTACDS